MMSVVTEWRKSRVRGYVSVVELVRFPNPLAPGSDIQILVSWGT